MYIPKEYSGAFLAYNSCKFLKSYTIDVITYFSDYFAYGNEYTIN
jgi:hypothetical protein